MYPIEVNEPLMGCALIQREPHESSFSRDALEGSAPLSESNVRLILGLQLLSLEFWH